MISKELENKAKANMVKLYNEHNNNYITADDITVSFYTCGGVVLTVNGYSIYAQYMYDKITNEIRCTYTNIC